MRHKKVMNLNGSFPPLKLKNSPFFGTLWKSKRPHSTHQKKATFRDPKKESLNQPFMNHPNFLPLTNNKFPYHQRPANSMISCLDVEQVFFSRGRPLGGTKNGFPQGPSYLATLTEECKEYPRKVIVDCTGSEASRWRFYPETFDNSHSIYGALYIYYVYYTFKP